MTRIALLLVLALGNAAQASSDETCPLRPIERTDAAMRAACADAVKGEMEYVGAQSWTWSRALKMEFKVLKTAALEVDTNHFRCLVVGQTLVYEDKKLFNEGDILSFTTRLRFDNKGIIGLPETPVIEGEGYTVRAVEGSVRPRCRR